MSKLSVSSSAGKCAAGALLFGGTLGLAPAAQAGLQINGQFLSTYVDYYFPAPTPYQSGGGVFATNGSWWNPIWSLNSTSGLLDAGLQATGVSFSTSMSSAVQGLHNAASSGFNGFGGTANQNLMNSYAYSKASSQDPNTFSFQGLTQGKTFDLYIYTQPDYDGSDRQMGMTVQGVTQIASPASVTLSTFVLGQNYLKFSGITVGSDGTISGSWWKEGDGKEADWNGFQLIETTAVPAPGAVALMSLAGVFSGRRRRA